MPSDVDDDDRTVAEQIVAAGEGQHRWAVEVVVDRRTAFERIANPSHRGDGSRCDPVVFGPVQVHG